MSQTDLHGLAQPLAKLLTDHQPDLVHIHHLMRMGVELVGLIRRCAPRARIVMTLHDYYAICANDGQMVTTAGALCETRSPDACLRCFPDRSLTDFKLRDLHIGTALKQVDHFIAPSRFLRDRFVAWGLPAERISILPNGLPGAEASPSASQRTGATGLAFSATLTDLRAPRSRSKRRPDCPAPASPMRSRCTAAPSIKLKPRSTRFEQARAAAPDARYRGQLRQVRPGAAIAEVDWVVFPSEWWENAPLVINEAFQHHRPVICSAIGGARELVQDGVNGLHFPVGDAAALAEIMQRGIEEPGLWQNLVAGITPPVGIEESAARHLALYRAVLADPGPAEGRMSSRPACRRALP